MDRNDENSQDTKMSETDLEQHQQFQEEKSLWLMAVERQKYLEELEVKYIQLYEEGKEDGYKLAIRIAVEEKYQEDMGVWLHGLSTTQSQSIVPVMLEVDEIKKFKQVIEAIR